MSSSSSYLPEPNSQIHQASFNSVTSDDDNDDFIDDEDDDSNDRSNGSVDNPTTKKLNKKTLGRVKIKMAYIDNKIRRYTTFSKRKTGIMKKAYELATLTGTEVMLLVASETGHVYTYATPKLQPMITSEAGKALIQTCLAKDESVVELPPPSTTTLNNNDVIFVDENQQKKRANTSADNNVPNEVHPAKRPRLKPAEKIEQVNTNNTATSLPTTPIYPPTFAVPLTCLVNPDGQQPTTNGATSYTIDLNSLSNTGMNIVLAPLSNTSQPSPPSNLPFVLTLGNFPYQPS